MSYKQHCIDNYRRERVNSTLQLLQKSLGGHIVELPIDALGGNVMELQLKGYRFRLEWKDYGSEHDHHFRLLVAVGEEGNVGSKYCKHWPHLKNSVSKICKMFPGAAKAYLGDSRESPSQLHDKRSDLMATDNQQQQSHDKRCVKDFLMHLAGELQIQECARQNRPVPPTLEKGVAQFRNKFGNLCFVQHDNNSVAAQHAVSQSEGDRRPEQLKQVRAVIALLNEVEVSRVSRT